MKPKKTTLQVETLEKRDLLAVTSAILDAGTLRVVCDAGHDQVEIRETSSGPIINIANPGEGATALTGTITVKDTTFSPDKVFTFNRSEVQRIEVDMGGGGGRMMSDVALPTLVRIGDGGLNNIETGSGNDTVFGGSGNDTVMGGYGDDVMFGDGGTNALFGQGGNDTLVGGFGTNFLNGGADNDRLVAISRNAALDGGDGHDSLFVQAGTPSVHGGEEVIIAMPSDQPQTDGNSSGANSGSRMLRSLGLNAPYADLRRKLKPEKVLAGNSLGVRPPTLLRVLKGFKADLELTTRASFQNVLDFLRRGKPVVAMVSMGSKKYSFGGKSGVMKYVVLNGFDMARQTVNYVDTNGAQGTWTFKEFDNRWKWFDDFTGFRGEATQKGLELLGLRKRTFIA